MNPASLKFFAGWRGCLIAMLIALFANGCAVGPNYHRPDTHAPDGFREDAAKGATNSLADFPWWKVFPDATLQHLIRTALTNNYDLRIAVARVDQARAVADEARSELLPQIGYEGGAGRGKNVVAGAPSDTGGGTGNGFFAAGTASWEIDVWGRIRRLTESARAQYFATDEARRDVLIGVISQVAQSYFQLLALDRELEIARRTTNSFGESLKIFNQRLQGGVGSKLETSAAEAALASVAAQMPELEREIVLQENQLAILLGENPGPVDRQASLLDEPLADAVPPGLPSALLERRPDIREAEQLLRSANAQVGVATADFFPRLALTGLFGQVSSSLSSFTAGAPNSWSVAANLTGPIFEGGLLKAQYKQAIAARKQYALQYQASVLNAFREVSNALISREKYAAARAEDARAVSAYQEAVKIAMARYRAGQSSYYEVLQEQQLLFPEENSLVQTELNQLNTLVQLYQSLGGGWQNSDDGSQH